ncbi:MAG: transcription antitermination factor NusB [bacterium]
MGSRHEAREWAVQLLFQLDFNPGDAGVALAAFWEERKASAKSRQFVEDTVRGVLANQSRIDETIQKCAQNWSLSRMAGVDRNIIRLSVYEMLCCTDIPHVVSINEAVDIAKALGDVGSPRFVNGVLDRLRKDLAAAAPKAKAVTGGKT